MRSFIHLAAAAILFTSCNMSKHYANMRIGHYNKSIEPIVKKEKQVTEEKTQTMAFARQNDSLETAKLTVIPVDSACKERTLRANLKPVVSKPVLPGIKNNTTNRQKKSFRKKTKAKPRKKQLSSPAKSIGSDTGENIFMYTCCIGLACWLASDMAITTGITFLAALLQVFLFAAIILFAICVLFWLLFKDVNWGKLFFWTWQ